MLEEESYEYFGPVKEMKGGGGGSQTVRQTAEPPKFQIPFIKDMLERAQGLMEEGGPKVYQGRRVAPRDPLELQAQRALIGSAVPRQQTAADMALAGQAAQLAAVDPQNNPFFQSAVRSSIEPVFDALMRRALPAVRGNAISTGGFGGSRQGIAEGLAISDATRQALQTTAQLGNQAYQTGVQAAGRATALAPTVQQAAATAPGTLARVGEANRAYQQILLDTAKQKFMEQQQRPYENLAWYAGMVGNPLGSAITKTAPGPQSSPLSGALGGAALGASVLAPTAAVLGGAPLSSGAALFGMSNPLTLPMVGLGALLGAFG